MANKVEKQNLSFAKFLTDDFIDFSTAKLDPYATFKIPYSPNLE